MIQPSSVWSWTMNARTSDGWKIKRKWNPVIESPSHALASNIPWSSESVRWKMLVRLPSWLMKAGLLPSSLWQVSFSFIWCWCWAFPSKQVFPCWHCCFRYRHGKFVVQRQQKVQCLPQKADSLNASIMKRYGEIKTERGVLGKEHGTNMCLLCTILISCWSECKLLSE